MDAAVQEFRALSRLLGPRGDRCELCAAPLAARHAHLLTADRHVVCACPACGLLFGAARGRYRRIPSRIVRLGPGAVRAADWQALGIPIGLAFLYRQDSGQAAAIYPSPAGPVEAPLESEIWARIIGGCRPLATMEPEVEGLLAERIGPWPGVDREVLRHYLAPRDRCLVLAALLRRHWRGFSGGEAWDRVEEFFAGLDQEAVDAGFTI